jgi:predicted O-linked N-acetylglucosamine transferase (SPINDLY family)
MTSKRPLAGSALPLPPAAMETLRQAMAAHQAGKFDDADTLYRRVLKVDAQQHTVLQMLGVLHAQRGNYQEAERQLHAAISLNPNDAGGQFNYGNVLLGLQRFDEAFTAFGNALAVNPALAEAELNRGSILVSRKRFEEAIACFDAAIRINRNYAEAHCNRGHALEQLKRYGEALASCDAALAVNPQNAEFLASRASILHHLKREDEALNELSVALSLQPANAAFQYNRGNILFELKRFSEAVAAYDDAFRRDPQLAYVEGDRLFAKLMICDWTNLAAESERLVAGVAAGRSVARPFAFQPVDSAQAMQTRCANLFADHEFPAAPSLSAGQRYRHDRIRLAYLSADYRGHPVSHLLAGMFECHDKSRFETTAVSFGVSDSSSVRRRIEKAFDRFVEAGEQSDTEVARLLRESEIDIAIDLMGPTQGARPTIFAWRPAPIQAIYLGYGGSSGAPYFDYVLADRFVIPESEQDLYREKIVYLPDSFMGADAKRPVSSDTPSRSEEGLPESGFVFSAFSNSYKISPQVFDVWMNLLREINGSVLWFTQHDAKAMDNLRREARLRNVAPERLIFARRVAHNHDHLARLRLADLFLDTVPLGAHSTVCDTLWAGTPVLTCTGATFGGRVATSLLSALGLTELVADGLPNYRECALKLARDPQMLAPLRARLAAHRDSFPLFNTQRFTRHIEAAYTAMWDRHQRGEPPASISVPVIPPA